LEERRDLQRIGAQSIGMKSRPIKREISSHSVGSVIRKHQRSQQHFRHRLSPTGRARGSGLPIHRRAGSTSYREMVPISKSDFSSGEAARVAKGPVKENILRGAAIDLNQLPVRSGIRSTAGATS